MSVTSTLSCPSLRPDIIADREQAHARRAGKVLSTDPVRHFLLGRHRINVTCLLNDRFRRRFDPCDLDLIPIDHLSDPRANLVLPPVALIDFLIQSFPFGLTGEARKTSSSLAR